MLIDLPPELWMAYMDWLREFRREMAAKFTQLKDRKFLNDICQPWLHTYTKNVQLGKLYITSETVLNKAGLPEERGRLKVAFADKKTTVPFAQVPMPANIKGFEELHIRYLDSSVLNFLRLMPFWTDNNNNIRLSIKGGEDRMMTSLGHFLPLLRGTESILFDDRSTKFFHTILRDFPDQINSAKLLVMTNNGNLQYKQIVDWLCTKRGDGNPRMAVFYDVDVNRATNLIHHIHKQFLTATSPASFFVGTYLQREHYTYLRFPLVLDGNGTTGEQFIVRKLNPGPEYLDALIGRCPLTVDGSKWLEEMHQLTAMPKDAQELENWGIQSMLVTLSSPLIGPMESGSGEEAEEETEEQLTAAEETDEASTVSSSTGRM